MIKLFDPHVTEEEVNVARDVLLSRNWASGAGTHKVKEFEDKFSSYLPAKGVVAVNSGTAALHLALSLFDIRGKDILVPSLTFVSTAHAAVLNGGNPVFVDVDPITMCMDPNDLLLKIRPGKSALVIPVHFGGMPCKMDKILEISRDKSIQVIDDAAHACGATYQGNKIGSLDETLTCFSFHPVKNLSMPTGGAISINKEPRSEFRKRLNSLRWCGIDNREGYTYDVTSVSPNYYMNEISAAIGLVQLTKLEKLNSRRRQIARRYCEELRLSNKMPYSEDCVYHLYWILSDKRDAMIKHLNKRGIEVGTHYRPIHTMTAYLDGQSKAKVPVTEEVGNKIITLPIHTNLTDDDISVIIDAVNYFDKAK